MTNNKNHTKNGGFLSSKKIDLSPTERKAIKQYTDGSSLWMNKYLREQNMDGASEKDLRHLKRFSALISKAITKSPRSTAVVKVYRAVELIEPSWGKTKVGEELPHTKSGLISTSFSKAKAKEFLEDDDPSCLLILTLPKGVRGLYLKDVSYYDDEDELLLPHRSIFKVSKRSYVMHKKKRVLAYHARLVKQMKHRVRPIPK